MGNAKKGWMDAHLIPRWMDKFIKLLKARKVLSPTRRHLVVLDGHKTHVTLDVIVKAKQHGVDLLTLPNHTNHELQPLHVACFRSFKQAFKAHKDVWSMSDLRRKFRKEDLAQWVFLSLKKTLTPSNIRLGFKECHIWPLKPQAMTNKMEPSNTFKPMDVEVEEYVEEILENGG